jgi:hypothetical protein
MLRIFFFFSLLLTFTPLTHAKIYTCDDGNTVTFSSIPCDNQAIVTIAQTHELFEEVLDEEFILPVYSEWGKEWQQTVNYKLTSFSESEYIPTSAQKNGIQPSINLQTRTNLPASITIQNFASSFEDTINSICERVVLDTPQISNKMSNSIFYGRYVCSKRRDTQRGELGIYKIIQGDKGVYLVTVKWSMDPLSISYGQKLAILDNKYIQQQFQYAKKYLQHDAKLCKGSICY